MDCTDCVSWKCINRTAILTVPVAECGQTYVRYDARVLCTNGLKNHGMAVQTLDHYAVHAAAQR